MCGVAEVASNIIYLKKCMKFRYVPFCLDTHKTLQALNSILLSNRYATCNVSINAAYINEKTSGSRMGVREIAPRNAIS